jgi:SAM-dependent MidA family methyltransferase
MHDNGPMILDQIRREIGVDGPMGFDRFMEIALYDPVAGYFGAGTLRSDRSGDFLTSPEVSPLFGETIAAFVATEFDRVGSGVLVESGAGSGTLLRSLLDTLTYGGEVLVVERSAAARAALTKLIPEASLVDEIPAFDGVLVANELLDNLAAALVVRRGSGWMERRVASGDDGLVFVEIEPSPDLGAWADQFGGLVPEGGQVEVQLAATSWVKHHVGLLGSGAILVVDYGDLAANLENRRAEGTVRTYRDHHLGPDPLAEPGATDITMDVNFSAVVAAAQEAGAVVEFMRQDEFLERYGLVDRIRALRAAELEAARTGRIMERLQYKSSITDAETLLHPRGLGDFRVAVLRK